MFVDEDDDVVHLTDRAIDVGTRVSGTIDWTRRFDHMQQHTGQHVLSAAYDRLFGVRTESFHLGAVSATIDLHREVTPAEIRDAEDEANRIVWEDRPVSIRFVTAEEAAALPLRKEPARAGSLRLDRRARISICRRAAARMWRAPARSASSRRASWEKLRGGTRVEFLCGGRALARFREWRDALSAATRHLSVTPPDLGGRRSSGCRATPSRSSAAMRGAAGAARGARGAARWSARAERTARGLGDRRGAGWLGCGVAEDAGGGGDARSAVGGGRALQPDDARGGGRRAWRRRVR